MIIHVNRDKKIPPTQTRLNELQNKNETFKFHNSAKLLTFCPPRICDRQH
jgi:hypothetical protein